MSKIQHAQTLVQIYNVTLKTLQIPPTAKALFFQFSYNFRSGHERALLNVNHLIHQINRYVNVALGRNRLTHL